MCGLVGRGCCNQSRNVIESTHHPLPLVPGWVTLRVLSDKNLATHTRVANLPLYYQPY